MEWLVYFMQIKIQHYINGQELADCGTFTKISLVKCPEDRVRYDRFTPVMTDGCDTSGSCT